MKILVAGSRTFTDRTLLELELGKYLHRSPTIISGGAKGADTLAEAYAGSTGLNFVKYPADWQRYGKSAGMIRNRKMIDEERPTRVLVFYGVRKVSTGLYDVNGKEIIDVISGERSAGTAYTEEYARGKGIPVEVFFQDSVI